MARTHTRYLPIITIFVGNPDLFKKTGFKTMKKATQLLLILCLLLLHTGSGQALPFQTLSTDHGLSNRRVQAAVKDREGYIWFATRIGVDRYNGETFTHYTLTSASDELTEHPRGIITNRQQEIYAFSERHIYRYNPDTDSFETVKQIKLNAQEAINVIAFDPAENLWIGTTEHLYRKEKGEAHIRIVKQKMGVHCILFEGERHGWVGTSKGVIHLVEQEDGSHLARREKHLTELNNKRIQSFYYDSLTHLLWIGTFSDGLYLYNKTTKVLSGTQAQAQAFPIRSITRISSDRIWMGIDGMGITEHNRFNGKQETEFTQNATGTNHITANSIYHILNNGSSVWICTYTAGVIIYNKSTLIDKLYTHRDNNTQSLINNHVNCLLEDSRNRLWMGTNRGISRYDRQTGQWKHFLNDNQIDNAVILSLHQDNQGNILAGGYAGDVVRIDSNDRLQIIELPSQRPNRKDKRYIYSIVQDADGTLWLGGIINDLLRYNPKTKQYQYYPVKGINKMLPYGQDTLLIASNKGLLIFNKTNGKITLPIIDPKEKSARIIVQALCLDPSTTELLWIATEGKGVFSYNLKTGASQQYTQTDGLSSNSTCGIQYDGQGRIWISTENGLNCLHPNHRRIDTFYEPDGLPDNILNFRSYTLLSNGHIAWGTPEGAFELNPDELVPKKKADFNLRFEEFALFNVPVTPRTEHSPLHTLIDRTDKLYLSHDQHSFSFRFLNLGYLNAAKNSYTWKLEGFDKMWSLPTDHHHAVYTNIPPGTYTFRVKVFSGGDAKDFQERSLIIVIAQPWWNTWVAWCVYIGLSTFLGFLLMKAYKDRLEARDSDQKIRFFINIAHDIRTPLTLIKAPLNEIEEETLSPNGQTALTLAQRNVEKLLNMVTQLLDFQKLEREAMTLQVEETELNSFIGTTISNFEPLAREKQIDLHAQFSMNESCKGYIDRRKVSIILDNLLSNSIKYTCQHGNVWIKSCIDKDILNLEVTDDGIGVPTNAQKQLFNRFYRAENAGNSKETGSGIGLLLTKKMALLHKGDIEFHSQEGVGTTFRIKLPIGQSAYSKAELIQKECDVRPDITTENTTSSSSGLKLLLVEDNEELRHYLGHYLGHDYHVLESPDGKAALVTIAKENPDFILSDVMMPELSGIDLCRQLKANIETCHIPIILLTSLTEREDVIRGLNAGADDYITKPFDLPVLKSKIATILNNRTLYRRKYIDKSAFNDESIHLHELDKKFMEQVVEHIEEKMVNEDFSIDTLAMEMAMSRSVFFKKMKSLTGQSPQDFIRDLKMKRAATLLNEKKYSISEIAYLTGFPNSKYFSTAFKKYYGKTPSEFV